MKTVVWVIANKLNKGVSTDDYLLASKKCHDEIFSKQKGFISWDVIRDDDTWIDLVKWESAEDASNAQAVGVNHPVAHELYPFLDMNCSKLQVCSVEKSHHMG